MNTSYSAPTVTVDAVIFQLIDGRLSVLLIKRAVEPFAGIPALPGGYCNAGETTRQALERAVSRKSSIPLDSLGLIEQLYTFDAAARDPRGPAVSVSYLGLGRDISIIAGAATEQPFWCALDELPGLAFDHQQLIDYALGRLRSKLSYTNAIFALLPLEFTLSELQSAYEAVIGHPLDKRNFRKKFLSFDLIFATADERKDGAHRPARLYGFNHQHLESLPRNFD